MACFYAAIIGLLGFVFPIHEALTSQWQTIIVVEVSIANEYIVLKWAFNSG